MKAPFFSRQSISPFDALLEHAEKVKECAWAFQQAMECYVSEKCILFEEYRTEVHKLENMADSIKRRIRSHIPSDSRLPISLFQLFMYLKEQDHVLDSVEKAVRWLSYRMTPKIPGELEKDFFLLVDSVIEPIEDLSRMVAEAKGYFETYSQKQREAVKDIIRHIRKREHESDLIEGALKKKIFAVETDPVGVYHLITLVECIGSIADHAENSGDMMRAMIARKKGLFYGV
ncbi:MAG: TIGR00153 family protein [Desulfobacteraceae bacterium]|nr:TIGR00153 family protein [Desulfobacteraceae bacterium]MBU4001637.1 TIGR00153 family protein [Pseudomonadota bacterium]MBU4055522.1 TIGR00153 family protein [Pseudomonadota bacterium]